MKLSRSLFPGKLLNKKVPKPNKDGTIGKRTKDEIVEIVVVNLTIE